MKTAVQVTEDRSGPNRSRVQRYVVEIGGTRYTSIGLAPEDEIPLDWRSARARRDDFLLAWRSARARRDDFLLACRNGLERDQWKIAKREVRPS